MSVFNFSFISDEEIWSKIDQAVAERDEVQRLLADPEICRDTGRMPALARRLQELDQLCLLVEDLRNLLKDKQELESMISERSLEEDMDGFRLLYEEYVVNGGDRAGAISQWLIDNGYLEGEFEDETDLKILKFIDYAGPEYAWRLSINIGISWEESRRRLATLLKKGLLERVEGNMLGNYHREKSWTKHMNHTYYRISREGRLYLRRLRRED